MVTFPNTSPEVFKQVVPYKHVGVHVEEANDNTIAFLYYAWPGIVTWMDWANISQLKQYCFFYKARFGHKPMVIARRLDIQTLDVTDTVKKLDQLPHDLIDYYVLVNEPLCTPQLNAYTVSVLNARPTLKILVGCLAEGNPANLSDITFLLPAIRLAKEHGGGLALHEYSKPRMQTDSPWHCGRFELIRNRLPADLTDIDTFILECGIDGAAITTPDPVPHIDKGWRDYTTENGFLEQLQWYAEYTANRGVKGVTIFNLGTPRWKGFELAGAYRIAGWIEEQQVKVIPTKYLYLAICPSNQDIIKFGNIDERIQMALLASRTLAVSRSYSNVVCKVFIGLPQSEDPTYLQGLKAQMSVAAAWLKSFPNDSVKVMINLHTDSSPVSHLGFYWWNQGHSRMLGGAINKRLEPLFKTGKPPYNADYSNYIFVQYTKEVCTPLLLELGSHQNAHDLSVVKDMGYLVGRAIMEGTLEYFKPYL